MPLVIISLIVLVLITGTTIFFLNTRETEKNEKLNPKTEEKKAKEKNKDDSEKEEKIEEPVVEEEATQNTEEPTQNNNTNFSNNNNISSSSSSSNKSNNNNNYVAPSSPPVQNQQPQQTTPEPTCTPKKFDIVFRADFSSEAECDAAFNYYNSIDDKKYTSYKCSNAIDDCGVTYYMLTFYDINGNRFGYNEI